MTLISLAYYIAPLIGLMLLIIGVCAVIWPKPMAVKFGIPADEKAIPYVISTGIRDVSLGIAIFILIYMKLHVALGAVILSTSLIAGSDFVVVNKYGDKKVSYMHLFGAVSVLVYGFWLMTQV